MSRSIRGGLALCRISLCSVMVGAAFSANAQSIFINEIHYDNAGTDSNEAVEIAGPAGTDASNLTIVPYNGGTGQSYTPAGAYSGTIPNQQNGFGTLSVNIVGLQNGSPDGLALVRNGTEVLQFLCYEGVFAATNGPASGMTCTDIGVTEPGDATTPVGNSLRVTGSGTTYQDFAWQSSAVSSFGAVNQGQTFVAAGGTSFSINDVTMAEGDSGTINFVFTVSKSGSDAANVSFATSDDTATQPADYSNSSGTLSFAAGDTSKTFSVPVVGDAAVEGNENFTVTLSNPTNGATLGDATGTGTISNDDVAAGAACGDPATLISAVQGSGASTPLSGTSVQIEGIVVGDFQGSTGLKGFFVQEEDAQADGNPATSEGIFVFEDAATPATVAVNDRVRVMGMASESFGLTVISGPTTTFCAANLTAPAATAVNLPFAALDSAERFEGMKVTLPQQLFVTDNFTLGRFGEVVLSSGDRLTNPTQNNLPGAAAVAAQTANNLNKILIDDGSETQNRDPIKYPGTGLTALNTLRGGDTVTGIQGVMSFGFSTYRVQPTANPLFVATNARTAMPDLPGAVGSFRIASFNVLNYFNGPTFPTARGANTAAEFTRQRDKIIAALTAIKADVIGVIEMENDDFGSSSALADLVNGMNTAAASGTTYAYVTPAAADLNGTKIGGDEIKVSFIYRTQTASLVGGAKILDSEIDPDFIDTCNRPVLAQTFQQVGGTTKLTVAVNHFKSKGSACAALNDVDTGDGQGNANTARTRAAEALRDWLATDPTASGDPDFLIIGDLNAYAKEDPIRTLETAGYVNLVQRDSAEPAVLSYPFDDQWGTLDYGLANATLASQVTKAVEWTINGAEPVSLDYNNEFKSAGQRISLYNADPYRSSDHDPVVMEIAPAAACNAGVLSFKNAPYTVAEAAGTLTVTVQRTGGSCGAVGATYATASGTPGALVATAGSDYTAVSGLLSWGAADAADKTFTVSISNDAIDEQNEMFGVGLSAATGGATFGGGMSTQASTATITDDDEPAQDSTPNAFTFVAQTNVAGNAVITSEAVTVTGISGAVAVSVTAGGEYSVNGGRYVSSGFTISNGQTLRVRHRTPDGDAAVQITTVTVGTYATPFRTTNSALDRTPDAYSFATQSNVAPGAVVQSSVLALTGFNTGIVVTPGAGQSYRIGANAAAVAAASYTTAKGTLMPGQLIQVRHTASSKSLEYTKTILTTGTVKGSFLTRTQK